MKDVLLNYFKSGKLLEILLMIGGYFISFFRGEVHTYFLFLLIFIYFMARVLSKIGGIMKGKIEYELNIPYMIVTLVVFFLVSFINPALSIAGTISSVEVLSFFMLYVCYHLGLIFYSYYKNKKKEDIYLTISRAIVKWSIEGRLVALLIAIICLIPLMDSQVGFPWWELSMLLFFIQIIITLSLKYKCYRTKHLLDRYSYLFFLLVALNAVLAIIIHLSYESRIALILNIVLFIIALVVLGILEILRRNKDMIHKKTM